MALFATSGNFDPHMVIARARPKHDPRIGRYVAVSANGTWRRAQIVDVRRRRFKVRYFSFDSAETEWVSEDLIRDIARPAYPVGATVEILWRGRWHTATVLSVRQGLHYIQYEGYGSEWNEWVALRRTRPIA